jgi:succinate dehydrogenase / fumarate reductase, iron-sulfur subunit
MANLIVKIKRQASSKNITSSDSFAVMPHAQMTIRDILKQIRKHPKDIHGKVVKPVLWDEYCTQGVCGSCTVLVNGVAKQSCLAKVEGLKTPVVIEPLSKFPVKRDLCVDRSSQQKGMKKTLTWNHVDSFTLTKNPPVFRQNTNVSNPSNACLHCSACMEACPEYHVDSAYVGPMVLLQAFGRSKDSHGKLLAHKRKNVLQSKQGMSGCDHVQNCVKACPVELPISESIAKMKRQGMQNLLKQFLG